MLFKKLAPKKFLWYFSLRPGALFTGIFMSCVALIACIVLLVQLIKTDVSACQKFVWKAAYSFYIIAIIYNIAIIIINLGLIWAVLQKKLCVILCWVIVTDVWLAQTFLLLIVLLCIYSLDVSFVSWVMSIIFGLLAMGILVYLSMVVYGYWLVLKSTKAARPRLSIITGNN